MRRTRTIIGRIAARTVVVSLVAGAVLLGGSALAGAATPVRAAATANTTNRFPKVTVTDIRTGKPFDLSTLAKNGKPVLAWFWAPY